MKLRIFDEIKILHRLTSAGRMEGYLCMYTLMVPDEAPINAANEAVEHIGLDDCWQALQP